MGVDHEAKAGIATRFRMTREEAEAEADRLRSAVRGKLAAMNQPAEPSPSLAVVTVRMSRELHRRLREAAFAERVSLNQFCNAVLDAATEVDRGE